LIIHDVAGWDIEPAQRPADTPGEAAGGTGRFLPEPQAKAAGLYR
jgi:hypothetical protein